MKNEPGLRGIWILSGLLAATLLVPAVPGVAEESETRQGQVLVDVVARILACSVHPCLGDSQKDVKTTLHGKIVTDGTFYFSELGVAYPATRDRLQGLVEWDLKGGLGTISLKIANFQTAPSVFLAQLEEALPGCRMDRDTDDDQAEAENDGYIPENEWTCSAVGRDSRKVGVDIYLAPGLVILEVGP